MSYIHCMQNALTSPFLSLTKTDFSACPEDYLKLHYTSLGFIVFIGVLLWGVGLQDIDFDNSMLKNTFGYNSLCVFFDATPTREISSVFLPFGSFFAIRYAQFASARYDELHRKDATDMKDWSKYILHSLMLCSVVISSLLLSLILVRVPEIGSVESIRIHTAPYIVLEISSSLIILHTVVSYGNYSQITVGVFYALISSLKLISQLKSLSDAPFGYWEPTDFWFALDIGWDVALALTIITMPSGPSINVKRGSQINNSLPDSL